MSTTIDVAWHTRLEHPFFRVSGCREADVVELENTRKFAPWPHVTPDILTKVLYCSKGRWFPGYFMARTPRAGNIVIQRCYGKLYVRLNKSLRDNHRKTVVCKAEDVMLSLCEGESLRFECCAPGAVPVAEPLGPTLTNNVLAVLPRDQNDCDDEPPLANERLQATPYTLYMIMDMVRTGRRCHTREDFYAWFEARYLVPSRRLVSEWFRIPHFADCDAAMGYLTAFKWRYPEHYGEIENRVVAEEAEATHPRGHGTVVDSSGSPRARKNARTGDTIRL